MTETIVYTTSTCPYCRSVKEFLKREGINFQEKNVQLDQQAAQDMVKRSGQMGVPVTLIANQVIVGFDQTALKNAVNRLHQEGANSQPAAANSLKLGAQVGDAVKVLAQQGQPMRAGAILGSIHPDSLVAKAGLRTGDIITRLDGKNIANAADLAQVLQTIAARKINRPGLLFWRAGTQMDTRLPVQFD